MIHTPTGSVDPIALMHVLEPAPAEGKTNKSDAAVGVAAVWSAISCGMRVSFRRQWV